MTIPDKILPLRVMDIKQYLHCPRITFYLNVMPVDHTVTRKMERGKIAEEQLRRLEERRTLVRYGMKDGQRLFRQSLVSGNLNLSGTADLVIRAENKVFPVEFKFSTVKDRDSYRYQLCAYALLLEDLWRVMAPAGFVYLIPADEVIEIAIGRELRASTREVMAEIRDMILNQRMPDPTPMQDRCDDCEYRNYCGDVA